MDGRQLSAEGFEEHLSFLVKIAMTTDSISDYCASHHIDSGIHISQTEQKKLALTQSSTNTKMTLSKSS